MEMEMDRSDVVGDFKTAAVPGFYDQDVSPLWPTAERIPRTVPNTRLSPWPRALGLGCSAYLCCAHIVGIAAE
jgi:hypothetical protein